MVLKLVWLDKGILCLVREDSHVINFFKYSFYYRRLVSALEGAR